MCSQYLIMFSIEKLFTYGFHNSCNFHIFGIESYMIHNKMLYQLE